jgi:MFS family permease
MHHHQIYQHHARTIPSKTKREHKMASLRRFLSLERNVLTVSLTVLSFAIPWNSWTVVLPLILEELGATPIDIGITYALMNITWYALQFPGGLLADKYGRKKLIVLPTFTFIVLYLVTGAAGIWWITAIALITINAFGGLQTPSFTSIIAESVDEKHRGRAFATYGFFVNIGLTLGPLMGAFLIPLYGYSSLFYITGVVAIFCGVSRLLFLHETRRHTVSEGTRIIFPKINRNLLWFLAGCSIFSLSYGIILPLMALYAGPEGVFGFSVEEVELMFFVAQFATCLTSIPSGKFIEKINNKICLMTAFIGTCLTMTAWAYSPLPWVAFTIMALSYVFYTLFWITYDSLISNLTIPQTRGGIFGIAAIALGIFTGAGSAIGSYLWENYNPILPFIMTGVLGLLSAIPLLKMKLPKLKS